MNHRYNYTKNTFFLFVCVLILCFFEPISAKHKSINNPRVHKRVIPKTPTVKAPPKAVVFNSFSEGINSLLSNKALQKTQFAVAVYSLDKQQYYYKRNIEQALIPASTTKLLTTYTALKTLGPDYTVNTSVFTDAKKINQELDGDLYFYGRGDMFLTISDIELIADEIIAKGIKKINGNIYADGSFFDKLTDRKLYSGDRDVVEAIPPVTAFNMYKNQVTVLVSSGSRPGDPLKVQTIPASSAFRISVTAKSGTVQPAKQTKKLKPIPAKSKRNKRRGDSPHQPKIKNYRGGVRISVSMDSDGYQHFTVTGSMPVNRSQSYKYMIQKPDLVAAGSLKDRLEAGGVKVTGTIGKKQMNSNPIVKYTLLAENKRPIIDLINVANKESDNYIAECIFKIIGGQKESKDNNAKMAIEVYKNVITQSHAKCIECMINDGSGLSRRNKVSAELLVKLLENAHQSNFGVLLEGSLSIAGIDGTLRKRMRNTRAQGNLIAKTGTHGNVSALAGIVRTVEGEKLAFAFIFNGPNVNAYKKIENDIGIFLSEFSQRK